MRDLWSVRRQLTLGLGLMVLQQTVGINTIMYYSGGDQPNHALGINTVMRWGSTRSCTTQVIEQVILGARETAERFDIREMSRDDGR